MTLYSKVQKKAQKELDDLLDGNRLVGFQDESKLPYVKAVCKEVLRWQPLSPQGEPHSASRDDIIGKFFIPKGTLIVPNNW